MLLLSMQDKINKHFESKKEAILLIFLLIFFFWGGGGDGCISLVKGEGVIVVSFRDVNYGLDISVGFRWKHQNF